MYPSDLDVRIMNDGMYMLLRPFVFNYDGKQIRVPKYFRTDFASIPRGLRWMVTGHDKTRKPAVVHDFMYQHGIGSRKEADELFKTGMKEEGVPAWKRQLCYRAVRVFGGLSWEGK